MPTAERIYDAHAELGEGPVWLESSAELLWVDIEAGDLHWLDPVAREDRSLHVEGPLGAAVPDRDGGVVLTLPGRVCRLRAGADELEELVSIPAEPDIRMNDAACDRQGRLFTGSMPDDESSPRGALYRVDADLRVELVLDGLTISNGIDWSPDDTRMYFVDSVTRRVDVLDYDSASGAATNRRPFHTFADDIPGMPDGLCVDREGSLWVAIWGGSRVLGISPEGHVHTQISLPTSQITSCAFGGPGLSTLFVTSAAIALGAAVLAAEPHAGGLFAIDVGVAGFAPTPFAG
jgi:sugar lactone lactonase YvrE